MNKGITNPKRRSPSRISTGIERVFLQNKLNSGVGVLLFTGIAVGMGCLLARNPSLGFIVFGVVLGLSVVITCLLYSEVGFYINLVSCFFVYQASRMFFTEDLPAGVLTDAMTLCMLFSFFIKGVSLKKSLDQFTRSTIIILIIFNFSYGALELFNPAGHSFEAWLQAIRRSFETLLFLFVTFQLLNNKDSIRTYIRALFILATLAALYGCIQQWHGLFNFERNWVESSELRFGLIFINGEFRKFSTFNDPTSFGCMMAACSIFFTILALSQRDRRVKRILLAGVVLMLLAMAYSGTRTANVMLLAGFGMFTLLSINKRSTQVFAFIATILFVGILYLPIYNNNTINRFRSSFMGSQDESYRVRELSRDYIRPYMLSHPFGGGLATTGALGTALNPGHFLAGFQTDSGYLQMALEIGWIGLALLCILFFFILKGGINAYFHCKDEELKPVYAAGISAIFCYYVGMFAQNTLGNITDMAFYYPVITIILQYKYYDEKGNATL